MKIINNKDMKYLLEKAIGKVPVEWRWVKEFETLEEAQKEVIEKVGANYSVEIADEQTKYGYYYGADGKDRWDYRITENL